MNMKFSDGWLAQTTASRRYSTCCHANKALQQRKTNYRGIMISLYWPIGFSLWFHGKLVIFKFFQLQKKQILFVGLLYKGDK